MKRGFSIPDQSDLNPRPNFAQTVVYFVTAKPLAHPIKIGRSTLGSLRSRLRQIQTSIPYDMTVLLVMPAEPAFETELHDRFATLRMRGEWFEQGPSLWDMIQAQRKLHPDWRSLYLYQMRLPQRYALAAGIP